MSGKGDKRRDGTGYSEGWDRIYGYDKKPQTKWGNRAWFAWEIFKTLVVVVFAVFVFRILGWA